MVKAKNFVDDMLKRDDVELEQFTDVIGDNPELVSQWKEGLADAWKQKSFNEAGRYSQEASKRWFKANENTLEYFFTSAEINGFKKTGKFAEKVAKQTKQLEAFVKKANTKWGSGSIAKVDPEGLSKFITDRGGSWATPAGRGVQERISKIKYVKNMTANHPRAWESVQNDFKQQIRNDIIDAKTGLIAPNKIAKWVSDAENAKVVKEVMGDRYLKDLGSINEVIKIINKKENRIVGSQAAKATIQAIRAGVAPPLTKRGRALTAMITFGNKDAQKRAADAILDGATMRKTADLIEHSANTRRFYEKAFSLGYALPEDEE